MPKLLVIGQAIKSRVGQFAPTLKTSRVNLKGVSVEKFNSVGDSKTLDASC